MWAAPNVTGALWNATHELVDSSYSINFPASAICDVSCYWLLWLQCCVVSHYKCCCSIHDNASTICKLILVRRLPVVSVMMGDQKIEATGSSAIFVYIYQTGYQISLNTINVDLHDILISCNKWGEYFGLGGMYWLLITSITLGCGTLRPCCT
jgi:hypothetical protein